MSEIEIEIDSSGEAVITDARFVKAMNLWTRHGVIPQDYLDWVLGDVLQTVGPADIPQIQIQRRSEDFSAEDRYDARMIKESMAEMKEHGTISLEELRKDLDV